MNLGQCRVAWISNAGIQSDAAEVWFYCFQAGNSAPQPIVGIRTLCSGDPHFRTWSLKHCGSPHALIAQILTGR
jgi:hypothetical protein